jgi:hypothetical protein
MSIEPWGRQHLHPIDREPLRLVDRGSVAMIDLVVVLDVERDCSAVVEQHGHAGSRDALDGPERAVLHAKAALVLQEHNPVAASQHTLTPVYLDRHILTKLPARAQPFTRSDVERLHFVVRVNMPESIFLIGSSTDSRSR